MAATCKHCDQRVLWCELPDGKRLPIDPAPVAAGDLKLTPTHPDAPMRVEKISGKHTGPRYKAHTDTCPKQERKASTWRDPSDPGPTEPTW